MSSIPEKYLEWAVNKDPDMEYVTFGNFVRRFDLSDRKAATTAYVQPIDSMQLRKYRRDKLKLSFRESLRHHETRFWAQRRLQVNSAIAANHAGVTVQEVGVIQAKVEFDQFVSGSHGHMCDDSLDDRRSEPFHSCSSLSYSNPSITNSSGHRQ